MSNIENCSRDLVNRLMSLKYRDKEDRYDYSVISDRHKPQIESAVIAWYNENFGAELGKTIGELEAKVKAYEAIISNSNFSVILQNNENDKSCSSMRGE